MLRSRRCRKTYVQKQTPKLEYRQNVVEYRRIPVEYRWNTGGIPAVRSPEILPDLTLPVYTCLFFVRGESTAEEGVRGRWWLGEARGATSKNCSASTRPVDPWSSGRSFCRTLLPFGSTEPWPYWRELFVCLFVCLSVCLLSLIHI